MMSKHLCFGWNGDSICEGYSDYITISCMGISFRFTAAQLNTIGAPSMIHYNMGVSGRLVQQYIDVAKSIIEADPTRFSAMIVSIWSPNKPPEAPVAGAYSTSPEVLAGMIASLEAYEAWLLERSIVFMPAFFCGSYSTFTTAHRVALQGHLDNCISKWPWLLNFNTPIQDPAYTDGPRYLSGTSGFGTDGIHPNERGYQAQYDWAAPRLMPAFAQACAAYGFVEA